MQQRVKNDPPPPSDEPSRFNVQKSTTGAASHGWLRRGRHSLSGDGKEALDKTQLPPAPCLRGKEGFSFLRAERTGWTASPPPPPRPWPSSLPKAGWGGQRPRGRPSPGRRTPSLQPQHHGAQGPGSPAGSPACILPPVPPSCSCVRTPRNGHEATTFPDQAQHRRENLPRAQPDRPVPCRPRSPLPPAGRPADRAVPSAGTSPAEA